MWPGEAGATEHLLLARERGGRRSTLKTAPASVIRSVG